MQEKLENSFAYDTARIWVGYMLSGPQDSTGSSYFPYFTVEIGM